MTDDEFIDALTVRQIIYCSDREFVREFLFTSDTMPNIHPERIWEWMNVNFEDYWIENRMEEKN